ncbi:hypothetical protein ACP70R_005700 [Stipagrostis hirtigluma subsp. patula]
MASERYLLLCLLLSSLSFSFCTIPNRGIRLNLTHIDAVGDLTAWERVRRAAERTHRRLNAHLAAVTTSAATTTLRSDGSAAATAAAARLHASSASYLVDLAIGTPPLPLRAIFDTGSDLVWTQCDAPCRRCVRQPTPLYAPAGSATYTNVSCGAALCGALQGSRKCSASAPQLGCAYRYSYGDGSSTAGVLATETFTLGSGAAVRGVAFGCSSDNRGGMDNSSGLVGMGRGPLSLASQLGVTRFSYCFTPFNDRKTVSPLFLGSPASLSPAAKSTPFVPSPAGLPRSSYYYLSLRGITVGDTRLPIDPAVFQLTKSGRGGIFIDSGTTFTALEERAFAALAREVAARVALPVTRSKRLGLGLCFAAPKGRGPDAVDVPRLVFNFDGADMELPRGSVVVEDRRAGVACLGFLKARGMTVFGCMQQQNMHVLYDLKRGVLSFEPAKCGEL